jgi:hypothetical protein
MINLLADALEFVQQNALENSLRCEVVFYGIHLSHEQIGPGRKSL